VSKSNRVLKMNALAYAIALSTTLPISLSSQANPTLEEVVVTATKRAESLQDVPISMIATSGEDIIELGITRGEDLTANLPAINIAQNPVGNFIFIRGVGSSGANPGIEQSVSIFHDGIYMGRHQLSRSPFMDLERVEVLRGPQSILFGKNTIGGAIHVISAKPTDEFEGSLSALYGWEDGEKEVTAVLSGPLSDSLSARLSLRGYEMDGYIDNVISNDEGPERDDKTVRAQLLWDVNDNITATAKWESSDFDHQGNSIQLATVDPASAGVGFSGLNQALVNIATGGHRLRLDDTRAVINDGGQLLGQVIPEYAGLPGFPDQNDRSENKMDTGTITLDVQLGEFTLSSISGFASYDYQNACDCDFSALPFISVQESEDYEQFSQEIRLTSPAGEDLEYIAGFYYHNSDLQYRSIEALGTSLASSVLNTPAFITPNLRRTLNMQQDQEMWSVFAQGTYNFSENFRVTLGARYYEESKEASHRLDKSFTGGWDYSAIAGLPAGTFAYGNTAAEYDRFLQENAGSQLVALSEGIYAGLLGTFEHNIVGRERDEQDWMWSLSLEKDLNEDTMVFASVATGTKGGGFDAKFIKRDDNPFFEYDEETAINYELGIKSYLFDSRMSLNATAFLTTVEDYQVSIFDGQTAFFVQNAAEVEAKGIEVDMRWAATDNLTLGFAGSYLNNEFTEFANAPCFTVSGSQPVNRGNCINRGSPDQRRDAKGDANQFSPEVSYNINLDYRMPIADKFEAKAVLNINYSDEYFVAGDLDPIYALQPSFTTVDLRLALADNAGNWEIAFLGKNLTDELISGSSNDQPLVPGNGFAYVGRLRSYAIQGTYRF